MGMTHSVVAEDISLEQVVLRGLDKVTGRLSTMTVKVGEKATFGALDIYARVCYTHPPEETPENAAYLDVVENKEEGQLKLFSGWMFSSSPVISAMEHAVYDVWVLKCQGDPVEPPLPQALVLENPIEPLYVQPKLKITLEDKSKNKENEEVPLISEENTSLHDAVKEERDVHLEEASSVVSDETVKTEEPLDAVVPESREDMMREDMDRPILVPLPEEEIKTEETISETTEAIVTEIEIPYENLETAVETEDEKKISDTGEEVLDSEAEIID